MTTLDPLGIYDTEQTARLALGHDVVFLYRHRRQLHAEGFPHPVSSVGHPRWSGADLIAWLQRPKGSKSTEGSNVLDFSQVLEVRAQAVATATGARRRRRS